MPRTEEEKAMKTNRQLSLRTVTLAGCALLALHSLSPQLAAKELVPYKATGWGMPLEFNIIWPTDEEPDGRVWGTLYEIGNATHLGNYEAQADIVGYFGYEGEQFMLYFSGTYVQVAADGSTITASLTGREPMLPFPCPFTMTMTIVEGTGRFKGASGSWDVSAISTGDYTFAAEGMISSVGSLRSKK